VAANCAAGVPRASLLPSAASVARHCRHRYPFKINEL